MDWKNNLTEYIKNWNLIENIKPENEEIFINNFIEMCKNIDDIRDIDFDEGSYGGKQIRIILDNAYFGDPYINFEIVYYTNERIVVYSGNHNGYWVPEFIDIDKNHQKFIDLQKSIFDIIYRVLDLPKQI